MANALVAQIFLIGFSRPDCNSEIVEVQAQFTGPDAFTGELRSDNRVIRMDDAKLGLKWDEDDILYEASDMFPMVQVSWMEAPPVVPIVPDVVPVIEEPPVVSTDETPADSV